METYGTPHDFGRAKAARALLGDGAGLPTPGTLAALPEGRMTVRQRAAGGPEPIRDQRRVASNGVLMVAGQKVAIGRQFKHTTLTVQSARRPWPSSFPTGNPRPSRTTDDAVRSIKGQGPRTADTSIP